MTAFCLSVGCVDKEYREMEYRHTLWNKSGKDIRINIYKISMNGHPHRWINTLNIPNNEELTFRAKSEHSNYDFVDVFKGDSIVINYQNERKKTYTIFFDPDIRNLFKRKGRNVTYIFEEADYNLATPCNGDCD
ncbi:MAG: hypothetical protein Q4G18_08650 [Myroides sp.]|nr:hypothetical protein [Myroides sp.]